MNKTYDTIVYIGRFEPFHNGHLEVLKRAFKLATQVIVIVGSANEPRTYKNPFTFKERKNMIEASCSDIQNGAGLSVIPIENSAYNDEAWVVNVQTIVEGNAVGEKIAIIGYKKDESSYYLDMFPQWTFIESPLVNILDATSIRSIYFADKCNPKCFKDMVPEPTLEFLKSFSGITEYAQIVREREFIEKYRKQYENAPYPPIFVTVDAVMIHSGHVLMVKRKSEPGKGLLAFPGGFVNAKTDRSLEDAMVRELKEETKINLPDKVIRGSIVGVHIFDKIGRSERGRIITHAHEIYLDDFKQIMPKVKGSDDAEKALWIPISKVKRENCFEDHYDILCHILGK